MPLLIILLFLFISLPAHTQHLSFSQIFEIKKLSYTRKPEVLKSNSFFFDNTYKAGLGECQRFSRMQADKYSEVFQEVFSYCKSGSVTYGTYSPDHATDLKFQLLRKYRFEDKGTFISKEGRLKNLYQLDGLKVETVSLKDNLQHDFWLFQIYDDPKVTPAPQKPVLAKQEQPTRGAEVEDQSTVQFSKGRYHALVIGVNDYKDKHFQDLRQPISDATNLADVLTRYYTFEKKDITFLKNPSRKEVIRTLDMLAQKLLPDDNLLIFFAGHGKIDESNGQGYWLPSDAESSYSDGWLSNSSIKDNIKKFKCRHILVVSDACFSGGLLSARGNTKEPNRSILQYYSFPSRKAITSTANSIVPDQSVFITYFIKRLIENSKTYLTAAELYVNMRDAVVNNSPTSQIPLYGAIKEADDEGGDFIFIKRTK